jgi:hypothetical protein
MSDMLLKMRVLILFRTITALLLLSPADGADANSTPPYLPALETEVLEEMNLARTKPARYAKFLEERLRYYRGNRFKRPREIAIITQEGVSAHDEAIEFLRRVKPVAALNPSQGISRAAKDHVEDQGPSGGLGHQGNDGSRMSDRVNRYGEWSGKIGENISYGRSDARDIVIQLIFDDGTPSRGHRKNLFDPEFRVVGVACGEHAGYGVMCVTTFAADYKEMPH